MKHTAYTLALLCGTASLASAATFYTPVSIISSNSAAYFPVSRLHQGPGVGYSAAPPHDGNTIGANTWVTNNPGGAGDYYNFAPAPVLVIDLGSDLFLTEISTWGYAATNTNGVRTFDLRFATSVEGTGGFGSTIPGQTGFLASFSNITRDSHPLVPALARYVEFTATDNWAGLQGAMPGGDRVGLGEIAFEAIPEPSTALLSGGIALFGLLRRRRS